MLVRCEAKDIGTDHLNALICLVAQAKASSLSIAIQSSANSRVNILD